MAAVLVAPEARADDWGSLYGYVDWTSDYRFYGASESNRHATEQGGLHWMAPDGYYAGVFVTGVDPKDFRNTSYEVDLYGGKHFYFDHNDLNLEALYSVDPDIAGHPTYLPPGVILPTYNFFETSAELTHTFGALSLGGKVIVSPRPESHGGLLGSVNVSASYAVRDWLTASGHAGHQWVERSGLQGTYWDIGVAATWKQQWTVDLRYYATDIGAAACYGQNWCAPAVVAKVTYAFSVL